MPNFPSLHPLVMDLVFVTTAQGQPTVPAINLHISHVAGGKLINAFLSNLMMTAGRNPAAIIKYSNRYFSLPLYRRFPNWGKHLRLLRICTRLGMIVVGDVFFEIVPS